MYSTSNLYFTLIIYFAHTIRNIKSDTAPTFTKNLQPHILDTTGSHGQSIRDLITSHSQMKTH